MLIPCEMMWKSLFQSSRKDLLQLMPDAEADAEDLKNINMWGIKDDTSDAKSNIGTHASNRKLTNLVRKCQQFYLALFVLI